MFCVQRGIKLAQQSDLESSKTITSWFNWLFRSITRIKYHQLMWNNNSLLWLRATTAEVVKMSITVKIFHYSTHLLKKTISALQFLILWFMVTIHTDEFSWNNELWFSCQTEIIIQWNPALRPPQWPQWQSPRYYGHFFLAAWQNGRTFSCKKNPC